MGQLARYELQSRRMRRQGVVLGLRQPSQADLHPAKKRRQDELNRGSRRKRPKIKREKHEPENEPEMNLNMNLGRSRMN